MDPCSYISLHRRWLCNSKHDLFHGSSKITRCTCFQLGFILGKFSTSLWRTSNVGKRLSLLFSLVFGQAEAPCWDPVFLLHYFNNGAHYISIKCQTFLTPYYNQSTRRSHSKTMFNNQTDNPSQYEAIPVCLLTEVSSDQKARFMPRVVTSSRKRKNLALCITIIIGCSTLGALLPTADGNTSQALGFCKVLWEI